MASNPNNCSTCKHKQLARPEDGHCYMFKDAPTEQCMIHTGHVELEGRFQASLVAVLAASEKGQRTKGNPDDKGTNRGCGACDVCKCNGRSPSEE